MHPTPVRPSIRERVLAAASGVQAAVGVEIELADFAFLLSQVRMTIPTPIHDGVHAH